MTPSLTFRLLALAALVGALTAPSLWQILLLVAIALAFAEVGTAYARNNPTLLGKRHDGSRTRWAWPLLWPFFLLTNLSLLLHRTFGKSPPITPIAPNLYLGRRLSRREIRNANIPFAAVLDLAAEFPKAPIPNAAYFSLPLLDATAPAPDTLARAITWIDHHTPTGPVLLHCALGHGRSATVAAAWLLHHRLATTPEHAEAHLHTLRPGIKLNPAQRQQLHTFAHQLPPLRSQI